MPLDSENTRSALATQGRSFTRLSLVIMAAVAAMVAAGNCCLKYLWWTACYSAWSGIPKMAGQWKAAGSRASFYGWSLLLLEVATVAVLCTGLRFRYGVRLIVSLASTITGTALSAWVLSWIR